MKDIIPVSCKRCQDACLDLTAGVGQRSLRQSSNPVTIMPVLPDMTLTSSLLNWRSLAPQHVLYSSVFLLENHSRGGRNRSAAR